MRRAALNFTAFLALCFGIVATGNAATIPVGGATNGATIWISDYYGQRILVHQFDYTVNPATATVTRIGLASRRCYPNAVAVHDGLLYIVCNGDFGGAERLLVYNATTNAFVKAIAGYTTKGDNDFAGGASLVAIMFDAHGNLWVSAYNSGLLLRIPAAQLSRATPRIDREVTDSPTTPAGLALDSDNSIWVVGQYLGGIVLNFTDAALNKPGDFLGTNALNPTPRFCISNAAGGCQTVGGLFNNPEGVAVFDGSIWVSNNGGNAPAKTIVRLQKEAGDMLRPTTYGGTLNQPFACPGGMFMAASGQTQTLWINDEGYDVTNTDCGASNADQSASTGRVLEFLPAELSITHKSTPTPYVFTGHAMLTTSSPGFGGIFVELQ